MPYASDFIDTKQVDTTAQTTADWDMVDAQIRERAFFMAGVSNARILQEFKDAARDIAAGKLTTNEARKRLRAALREAGYEPAEDERGGIHDLSSRRRMEVTLQTNVDLARGWQQREQMKRDKSQPGLRLFRARKVQMPRNWQQRWGEAAARINWEGVARGGEFVALIDSPIWREISRFGVPYPPFDFGSQMRVKAVPYEECERLGLFDTPEEQPDSPPETDAPQEAELTTEAGEKMDAYFADAEAADDLVDWFAERSQNPRQAKNPTFQTQNLPTITAEQLDEVLDSSKTHRRHKRQESSRTSLNDHVAVDIDKLDAATKDALEELMGSLLEVKDGKAQSSDLNGTRPYTPQELADIWKKGIPDWMRKRMFNYQQEALVQWINDSKQYDNNGKISPTLRQAMQLLLERLKTEESTETLYRGLSFDSQAEWEKLRSACRESGGVYSPLPRKMADSFGTKHNAEKYAGGANHKKKKLEQYQAILILRKHRSGKDLRPLYDAITTVQQNQGLPMKLEGEVLFMKGTRFRVVRVQREEKKENGITIHRDTYELEEI